MEKASSGQMRTFWAFEHAQNMRMHIILHMRKVFGHLLSTEKFSSRKHTYIILTPLNPIFI